MFFTDKTRKFCFFPVSKNANSTLNNMFFNNKRNSIKNRPKLRPTPGHDEAIIGLAQKTDLSERVKFTCVRNPLTRIVSGYLEIEKLRYDGSPQYTLGLPYHRILNQDRRFRQFICDIENNIYDTHILPQVYQMHDPDIMDYILLFDILLKDIQAFVHAFDIQIEIDYGIWKNRAENEPLKDHLVNLIQEDKVLQTKIIDMYSEDYELYMKVKKEKYERVVQSMESV